jgi:hypothetical protein
VKIDELKRTLDSLSVDTRLYDLNGLSPQASEGIVLGFDHGRWIVRSFERNHRYTYGELESEDEACALMLKLLSDPAYQQPRGDGGK